MFWLFLLFNIDAYVAVWQLPASQAAVIQKGERAIEPLERYWTLYPGERTQTRKVLKEVYKPRVVKLIKELGDVKFSVRQDAQVELAGLRWVVIGEIAKAKNDSKDPEVIRRLDWLLRTWGTYDDDEPEYLPDPQPLKHMAKKKQERSDPYADHRRRPKKNGISVLTN